MEIQPQIKFSATATFTVDERQLAALEHMVSYSAADFVKHFGRGNFTPEELQKHLSELRSHFSVALDRIRRSRAAAAAVMQEPR